FRHPATRDDTRSGERPLDRYHDPYLQRSSHLRGNSGTPRVRADQALSIGVKRSYSAKRNRVKDTFPPPICFAQCLNVGTRCFSLAPLTENSGAHLNYHPLST